MTVRLVCNGEHMKPPDTYISVRNWRKFQHYDPAKRRPVWIKTHLDLVTSDEYRDLSAGCRAVLHGIWLEYASTQCQLKFDAKSLSTRLNLRVTKQQLEALVSAGFLDIVASKVLADGYQDASPEVEVEEEEEEERPSFLPNVDLHEEQEGRNLNGRTKTEAEIVAERELGLPHTNDPLDEPFPSPFHDLNTL